MAAIRVMSGSVQLLKDLNLISKERLFVRKKGNKTRTPEEGRKDTDIAGGLCRPL